MTHLKIPSASRFAHQFSQSAASPETALTSQLPNPQISIIVAVFNEEGTIEACVRQILETYPEDCEVLVVDGGHDRTGEIVRALEATYPQVRYVRNENDRGKGHATQTGIAAARGKYLAEIDADLQFLPSELPRLIQPLRDGVADVVLGSRFMAGSVRRPGGTPWHRTMGNYAISLYASILFGQRMTDVLAGMMAWTAEAMQATGLVSDNYSYEVELPVKALKKGLRVIDVPVTTDARKVGRSNVNLVPVGFRLLWDIAMFRLGLR